MSADARKFACILGTPSGDPVRTRETATRVPRPYVDFSKMFTASETKG